MKNTDQPIDLDWHMKTAKDTFNRVWELIEKTDRSDYETLVMIHMAHASVYHWSYVGEAVNIARGEWQVSRVYCVAKMAESALYHAQRSLGICLDNEIGDFDLAFGYEAVAKALKLGGDIKQSQHYVDLAEQAAHKIAIDEDRSYFLSELKTI